jgi:hypothetical protein
MSQPAKQPRPVIQPGPTTWEFDLSPLTDGTTAVRIDIHSGTGTHVVFLPAEGAASVGQQLIDLATQARSGIATPPPSGLILPNGTHQ